MTEAIDMETGEVTQMPSAVSSVQAQDTALIDVQVRTARAYPRSVQDFQRDLETWATADQEIAERSSPEARRSGCSVARRQPRSARGTG